MHSHPTAQTTPATETFGWSSSSFHEENPTIILHLKMAVFFDAIVLSLSQAVIFSNCGLPKLISELKPQIMLPCPRGVLEPTFQLYLCILKVGEKYKAQLCVISCGRRRQTLLFLICSFCYPCYFLSLNALYTSVLLILSVLSLVCVLFFNFTLSFSGGSNKIWFFICQPTPRFNFVE